MKFKTFLALMVGLIVYLTLKGILFDCSFFEGEEELHFD